MKCAYIVEATIGISPNIYAKLILFILNIAKIYKYIP